MAIFDRIGAECNSRNSSHRKVERLITSLDLADYWATAVQHDFLICAGDDGVRAVALAEAVGVLSRGDYPTIIINSNARLQEKLIFGASNGLIGQLVVSSDRYKNYNLFCSLGIEKTLELIRMQAIADNFSDINEIVDYAAAFMRILCLRYPLNYNGLIALSMKSDEEIAAYARSCGARRADIEVIVSATRSGRYFRKILSEFGRAFSGVLSPEDTGYSLAGIGGEPRIYLIDAHSLFRPCFHLELAAELEYLMANGVRFNLIVSDVSFSGDDALLRFITEHRSSFGVLGICAPNISTVQGDADAENGVCSLAGSVLIIRTGGENPTALEKTLSLLGTYMYYEASTSYSRERGLHGIMGRRSVGTGMINYERLRVDYNDICQRPVAAFGHMGSTICLYKGIRKSRFNGV